LEELNCQPISHTLLSPAKKKKRVHDPESLRAQSRRDTINKNIDSVSALHHQALQVNPRPYAIIKRISQLQVNLENLMERVHDMDFEFKLRSELLALSNAKRALESFSQNLHKIDPVVSALPVPLTVKIESKMWKSQRVPKKPAKNLVDDVIRIYHSLTECKATIGNTRGGDDRFKKIINLSILDNCWKQVISMAHKKGYQTLQEISLVLPSTKLALEAERNGGFSHDLHILLMQEFVLFRISTLLNSETEHISDFQSLPGKDAHKQAGENVNLLNFFAKLLSVKKTAQEIYYLLSSYPTGTSCSIKPIFLNYTDLFCFFSPSLEIIEALMVDEHLDALPESSTWLNSSLFQFQYQTPEGTKISVFDEFWAKTTLTKCILQEVLTLMELAKNQLLEKNSKVIKSISEHPAVQLSLSLLLMYFAQYCWNELCNYEHLYQYMLPAEPLEDQIVKDLKLKLNELKSKEIPGNALEILELEHQLKRQQFTTTCIATTEWKKLVESMTPYFGELDVVLQGLCFKQGGGKTADHLWKTIQFITNIDNAEKIRTMSFEPSKISLDVVQPTNSWFSKTDATLKATIWLTQIFYVGHIGFCHSYRNLKQFYLFPGDFTRLMETASEIQLKLQKCTPYFDLVVGGGAIRSSEFVCWCQEMKDLSQELNAFSVSNNVQQQSCVFVETLIKASCMNLTMQHFISAEQLTSILEGLSEVELPEKPEEIEYLLREAQLKLPTITNCFDYIFLRDCFDYEPNTFAFADNMVSLGKELTTNFQLLSFGAEQLYHVLEQFVLQMVDVTKCEPRYGGAKDVTLLYTLLSRFYEIASQEFKENMDDFIVAVKKENMLEILVTSCKRFCNSLVKRYPELFAACSVLTEALDYFTKEFLQVYLGYEKKVALYKLQHLPPLSNLDLNVMLVTELGNIMPNPKLHLHHLKKGWNIIINFGIEQGIPISTLEHAFRGYYYVFKVLESGLETAVKLFGKFGVIGSSMMELDDWCAIFRDYCDMVLNIAQKPVSEIQSPVFALQQLHQLDELLFVKIEEKLMERASLIVSRVPTLLSKLAGCKHTKNSWERERDILIESREKSREGIIEGVVAFGNWMGENLGLVSQHIGTLQNKFDKLVVKCHNNGMICLRKNPYVFPTCAQEEILELKRKMQRKLRSRFSEKMFDKLFEEKVVKALQFRRVSSKLHEIPKLDIIITYQGQTRSSKLTLDETRCLILPQFDKISQITIYPSTCKSFYAAVTLDKRKLEGQKIIPFSSRNNDNNAPVVTYKVTSMKLFFPKNVSGRNDAFTIQKVDQDIAEISYLLSSLSDPKLGSSSQQDLKEFEHSKHNIYVVTWCDFCEKLKIFLTSYLAIQKFFPGRESETTSSWKEVWHFLVSNNTEFLELKEVWNKIYSLNRIFDTTLVQLDSPRSNQGLHNVVTEGINKVLQDVHGMRVACDEVMTSLVSLNSDLKCLALGGNSSSIVEVNALEEFSRECQQRVEGLDKFPSSLVHLIQLAMQHKRTRAKDFSSCMQLMKLSPSIDLSHCELEPMMKSTKLQTMAMLVVNGKGSYLEVPRIVNLDFGMILSSEDGASCKLFVQNNSNKAFQVTINTREVVPAFKIVETQLFLSQNSQNIIEFAFNPKQPIRKYETIMMLRLSPVKQIRETKFQIEDEYLTELRLFADLVEPEVDIEVDAIDLGILSPLKPTQYTFTIRNKVDAPVRVKTHVPPSTTCKTHILTLNPDQVLLGLTSATITIEIHPPAIPTSRSNLEIHRALYFGVGSVENIKSLEITGIVAKPKFKLSNKQGLSFERGDIVLFPEACPKEWASIDLKIQNVGIVHVHWTVDLSSFIIQPKYGSIAPNEEQSIQAWFKSDKEGHFKRDCTFQVSGGDSFPLMFSAVYGFPICSIHPSLVDFVVDLSNNSALFSSTMEVGGNRVVKEQSREVLVHNDGNVPLQLQLPSIKNFSFSTNNRIIQPGKKLPLIVTCNSFRNLESHNISVALQTNCQHNVVLPVRITLKMPKILISPKNVLDFTNNVQLSLKIKNVGTVDTTISLTYNEKALQVTSYGNPVSTRVLEAGHQHCLLVKLRSTKNIRESILIHTSELYLDNASIEKKNYRILVVKEDVSLPFDAEKLYLYNIDHIGNEKLSIDSPPAVYAARRLCNYSFTISHPTWKNADIIQSFKDAHNKVIYNRPLLSLASRIFGMPTLGGGLSLAVCLMAEMLENSTEALPSTVARLEKFAGSMPRLPFEASLGSFSESCRAVWPLLSLFGTWKYFYPLSCLLKKTLKSKEAPKLEKVLKKMIPYVPTLFFLQEHNMTQCRAWFGLPINLILDDRDRTLLKIAVEGTGVTSLVAFCELVTPDLSLCKAITATLSDSQDSKSQILERMCKLMSRLDLLTTIRNIVRFPYSSDDWEKVIPLFLPQESINLWNEFKFTLRTSRTFTPVQLRAYNITQKERFTNLFQDFVKLKLTNGYNKERVNRVLRMFGIICAAQNVPFPPKMDEILTLFDQLMSEKVSPKELLGACCSLASILTGNEEWQLLQKGIEQLHESSEALIPALSTLQICCTLSGIDHKNKFRKILSKIGLLPLNLGLAITKCVVSKEEFLQIKRVCFLRKDNYSLPLHELSLPDFYQTKLDKLVKFHQALTKLTEPEGFGSFFLFSRKETPQEKFVQVMASYIDCLDLPATTVLSLSQKLVSSFILFTSCTKLSETCNTGIDFLAALASLLHQTPDLQIWKPLQRSDAFIPTAHLVAVLTSYQPTKLLPRITTDLPPEGPEAPPNPSRPLIDPLLFEVQNLVSGVEQKIKVLPMECHFRKSFDLLDVFSCIPLIQSAGMQSPSSFSSTILLHSLPPPYSFPLSDNCRAEMRSPLHEFSFHLPLQC
jgi:hypothetical protein